VTESRSHTGRNIVIVGGAALVAWLLVRGTGWRLGSRGEPGTGSGASQIPSSRPCQVWIRSTGLEVDGEYVDRSTLVSRCQAAARAEVRATGDAIEHTIQEVIEALRRTGVVVYASADLWPHVMGGLA
jgi:hypothetical protein